MADQTELVRNAKLIEAGEFRFAGTLGAVIEGPSVTGDMLTGARFLEIEQRILALEAIPFNNPPHVWAEHLRQMKQKNQTKSTP